VPKPMIPYTLIDFVAFALAAIHFGVPLIYFSYLKRVALPRPWNVRADSSFLPKVSIIIPTYNEAQLITRKLNNIHRQNYPRDKVEIIVIDSASTDGTPDLVKKWGKEHPDTRFKLIVEPIRRGKGWALNEALKHVSSSSEIIIVTDVDSWWSNPSTLRKVVNMFADPTIGAVSCIKIPEGARGIEASYRNYYNLVRIGESKLWSTPIFHGELAAFRKKLIKEIGGFPTDIGADDSHTATLIALKGYRTIIHDSITCIEAVPRKRYFQWRVRRAQHLIQHFAKILKLKHKTPKEFKTVLRTETFLHLFNPWILLTATTLLIISTIQRSIVATTLLAIGIAALTIKSYRMWIHQQIALIIAAIRNLQTKELVWRKEVK